MIIFKNKLISYNTKNSDVYITFDKFNLIQTKSHIQLVYVQLNLVFIQLTL